MPYTSASSFRSAGEIGEDRWAAILAARGADLPGEIARLYHRDAPRVGLNPDLALAQAVEETGWFRSALWLTRRNACGLGITGPGVPGLDYGTPEAGIRAHLAHLCCYAYTAPQCPVHAQGFGQLWGDPRHLFHDGTPALAHLQEPPPGRRWAEGPGYVAHILAVLAVVGPGRPSPGPPRLDPLQPDGSTRLNGVAFSGVLARVERVEVVGVNAGGERFSRRWQDGALAPWVLVASNVRVPVGAPSFPGALQPDGRTVLNGVDFGGALACLEGVEVAGVNAGGQRFNRRWRNGALEPWQLLP